MAFQQEETITAVGIGSIVVTLKDAEDSGVPYKSAHYQVRVIYSDGSVKRRRGNLVPHIAAGQRTGLMNFMNDLRLQAESEFLSE